MAWGYPYIQLVHPQQGAVGCRAGAVGVPGEVWEAERRLLEDGWVAQPRAAPRALPPFLRVPVGESDLSPVPQFPHLKIKDK